MVMRGEAMRFDGLRIKTAGLLGAGLLGMLLGAGGTVKAQDAREEAKPQQEEPKKQEEARPARPQEENKEAKPSGEQRPPRAEEGKPARNEEKQNGEMRQGQERQDNQEMRQGKEQDRAVQNNDRGMQNHGNEHAAAGQRGQRIPDDKFRANFGREHHFRVQTTVEEGQPRFQYGGYWFVLADAWPADWSYSDDCYIDYIDGEYVLIDLLHPGIRLAVFVVE
jgi:hypothetical protein